MSKTIKYYSCCCYYLLSYHRWIEKQIWKETHQINSDCKMWACRSAICAFWNWNWFWDWNWFWKCNWFWNRSVWTVINVSYLKSGNSTTFAVRFIMQTLLKFWNKYMFSKLLIPPSAIMKTIEVSATCCLTTRW